MKDEIQNNAKLATAAAAIADDLFKSVEYMEQLEAATNQQIAAGLLEMANNFSIFSLECTLLAEAAFRLDPALGDSLTHHS